jgi:glycosyltransferase involved in cell wall biosynthesis
MISLVFTSFNGAKTLPLMLNSLTTLTPPKNGWKIIAVDNASTDETNDILNQFTDKLPLTILFEKKPGKNNALNSAIPYFEGEYIVFTDDDVIPNPDWLINYEMAAKNNEQYSVFAGQVRHHWLSPPPKWLIELAAEGRAYAGTPLDLPGGVIDWKKIKGPNLMVKSDIFEHVIFSPDIGPNGTSNYVAGSETEFLKRLDHKGHLMLFVPEASVKHIVRSEQNQLSTVLKRYFRIGKGAERLMPTQYEHKLPTILGFPRYWVKQVLHELYQSARYFIIGNSYQAVSILISLATESGRKIEWRTINKKR